MDHAASTVILFLVSIAATLALSAGGASRACRRLLEAHGRSGITLARALAAGLAGGGSGAITSTVILALIPPIRRSWDSIPAEAALQIGVGLLLGTFLGILFYLVMRRARPLKPAS